jgi:hypothetical protein
MIYIIQEQKTIILSSAILCSLSPLLGAVTYNLKIHEYFNHKNVCGNICKHVYDSPSYLIPFCYLKCFTA